MVAASRHEAAPSYAVVYRIIRSLSPALTTLAQEGEKSYAQHFDLIHRREADAPNAMWQADHSQLDILVTDDQGKARKPWLTVHTNRFRRTCRYGCLCRIRTRRSS